MRYAGVVFDLDGVLCFTDEYHYRAWKVVAKQLGVPFDRERNNRLRGVSRMDSLEILLEGYAGPPLSAGQKEELAAEKNAIYKGYLRSMSPDDLSADARRTLDALREGGHRLAVASSSRNAPLILRQLGLEGWFDATADGNEIARSKPDPEVFLLAAERMGLPPAACLVVEDAPAGIEAAVRGGFDAAGIGAALADPGSLYHLKELWELVAICG